MLPVAGVEVLLVVLAPEAATVIVHVPVAETSAIVPVRGREALQSKMTMMIVVPVQTGTRR